MQVYCRTCWSRQGWGYSKTCRPFTVRTEAQRTWRGWDPLKDFQTVEGHDWIKEGSLGVWLQIKESKSRSKHMTWETCVEVQEKDG